MPVKYSPAPEVHKVAKDVIRDHHTHLITNEVYVLYLFTDEAEKVKGKRVLGTAKKVSGLNAYLHRMEEMLDDPTFFLICIWEKWWHSRSTTDAQRRALVDHQLCHLWSEEVLTVAGERTGRTDLSILPHDLEEFNAIVDRHGAWEPSIEEFLAAYNGEGDNLFEEGKPEGFAPPKGAHGEPLTTRQAVTRFDQLDVRSKARQT